MTDPYKYKNNKNHQLWYIGCCFRVSYDSKKRRMWGSHMCVTIWRTTFLIVVLSIASSALGMIWQLHKPQFESYIPLYCFLIVLHFITTCFSLLKLYQCAVTEPGVIPTTNFIGNISAYYQPPKLQKTDVHLVRYLSKEELEERFEQKMGMARDTDYLQKHFSINKFEYFIFIFINIINIIFFKINSFI